MGVAVWPGYFAHAMLWSGSAESAVDLHPDFFLESWATGVFGNTQVGVGRTGEGHHAFLWHGTADSVVDLTPYNASAEATAVWGDTQVGVSDFATSEGHATLWHGTAESAVDLNPLGYTYSYAFDVSHSQQVGIAVGPTPGARFHAILWQGTADSAINLHPAEFVETQALGVSTAGQVGFGFGPLDDGLEHALYWNGTAASLVDLHPFLNDLGFEFTSSLAWDIDGYGSIVGVARTRDGHQFAVLWTPVPEPEVWWLIMCASTLLTHLRPSRP